MSVLTQRNDNARSGTNLAETALRISNVDAKAKKFGKLFSVAVDGNVYAQPLYAAGVTFPGGPERDVLYAATAKNNVYAIDAKTGQQIWARSLGASVPAADVTAYGRGPLQMGNSWDYKDLYPDMGITSTPVIDAGSKTIFIVAKTKEGSAASPTYHYRLHALNIQTGADMQSPVEIEGGVAGAASDANGGRIVFNPFLQLNRPGLLLVNGTVYVAFGSVGDAGPFHGWIFAYQSSAISQPAQILCTTPDSAGQQILNSSPLATFKWNRGGIWQSGTGLAADDQGAIYLSTGDGAWDGKHNFGDSYLKLDAKLNVLDWFTPWNHAQELDNQDVDLGSGGPVLLPGDLFIGGGKEGRLFVIRRAHLGHFSPTAQAQDAEIVQEFQVTKLPSNPLKACSNCFHHLHAAPVFWPSAEGLRIYVWPEMESLKSFRLSGGMFAPAGESLISAPMPMENMPTPMAGMPKTAKAQAPAAANPPTSMPGGILALSSNGDAKDTAIVWASIPLKDDANRQNVPGVLRAFDASDVTKEIWNSEMVPADRLGNFAKFCPPTVANGRVYMATFAPETGYPAAVQQTGPAHIVVYGLFGDSGRKRPVEYPTRVPPVGQPGGQLAAIREQIDPGVVRFFSDDAARKAAEPSYALQSVLPAVYSPAPAGFPVEPLFTENQNQESVTIGAGTGTSLYGTGMVVGPLLRNGQTIQTWNLDAYGYGLGSENLYQSHPWVLAVRGDGSAYGVLADTTHRCTVDTSNAIVFSCPPSFSVIVIDRPTPQGVVEELAKLTGYMPLPPKWALGYHQSKFSYAPAAKVLEIAGAFRADMIPCDAIWMDIDYMDQYRIFTFDPQGFPDPKGLNQSLAKLGFHNVWMIDPAVKLEKGPGTNNVFDSGNAGNVWVRSGSSPVSAVEECVWPGVALFPDFPSPRVRAWWSSLFRDFVSKGVDGVWNDMNEPSVCPGCAKLPAGACPSDNGTKTLPLDSRHAGDPGMLDAMGSAQGAARAAGVHERYHNVYGMMMARGTREGVLAAAPDHRPFVLARANYIGGQRYAATWTGDNTASWQHLGFSISMVLNLGLSGQPFAGPDIGGYRYDSANNPTQIQDAKLYARWIGIGALFPFSRGHYEKGYPWDKEPWAFGDAVTQTSRLALQRRYRLMPYLYSVFEEASRTGLPVLRPLFFADPKDPRLRAIEDEFLLGGDIMVAAQVQPDTTQPPTLPSGIWERFAFPQTDADNSPEDDSNPDLPALYLKGGAIVPSGPVMQFVDQKPADPLTLLVCLDKNGSARGTLYEDDGDGFDYLAVKSDGTTGNSRFLSTTFEAQRAGQQVTVGVASRAGRIAPRARNIRVRVFLDGKEYDAQGSEAGPIIVTLVAK